MPSGSIVLPLIYFILILISIQLAVKLILFLCQSGTTESTRLNSSNDI